MDSNAKFPKTQIRIMMNQAYCWHTRYNRKLICGNFVWKTRNWIKFSFINLLISPRDISFQKRYLQSIIIIVFNKLWHIVYVQYMQNAAVTNIQIWAKKNIWFCTLIQVERRFLKPKPLATVTNIILHHTEKLFAYLVEHENAIQISYVLWSTTMNRTTLDTRYPIPKQKLHQRTIFNS